MKSKIKPNIKTIAIVSVVLFSLIVPQIAKADILADILGAIGKDILITLGQAIHHILNWLLKAAAAVFDGVLDIGFNNDIIRVAKIGWGVTRDFSNMFFILFLVIVAFATILRLPQYGIRELLPKVIIIALLINFSFVIVAVIIDFSNIAAEFFIKDIRDKIGPEGEGIFGATFADSLGTTGIFITFANCEEFLKYKEKECQRIDNLIKNAVGQAMPFIGPLWDPSKCMKRAGELYGKCQKYGLITVPVPNIKSDVSFLNIFLSMTVGSIILLIAAFTLFAGAILLLIRIIALWLLIVIVPFVFICYIMPGLQGMWRKWWSAFLSWAFFAPAYAFFVWMAILIATAGINQAIGNIIQNPIGGDYGAFANPFLADPGAQLVGYGIIIAFLLGGLIMARQIGIYGAGATLNIAQKAGRGAKTWAARTTMRPVRGAATAVGAGALTAGGKLFGGKLGRRMQARAIQLRRAAEETPQNKAYAKLVSSMSNEDAIKEMMVKAITPDQRIRKLIATRSVARRGLLRDATTNEAKEAMKTFRSFNEFEEYQKLKESRLDAIEDKAEQEKTAQKVTQEGNLNKIPAIALKDERLVEAITKFATAVQLESLRKVSPQHGDELKDTLERITDPANSAAMIAAGIQPLADKIQHAFASQKGDVSRMSTAQKIDWAKKAGPEGLKRMTTFDADIAVNIPTAQLKNTLEKMFDATVTRDIVAHLKATPTAPAHGLATRDPYISNLG